jgi:membrane-associated protease RseP (regulator of RpoE activity)
MVVDDSPADKAGIEEHDILLAANGKKLGKLTDLVEIIREGKDSELTLELIHEGEKASLTVKPVMRPDVFTATGMWTPSIAGKLRELDPDQAKDIQVWVEKLQAGGDENALRLRAFGPGLALRGLPDGLGKIPSGISLNITKEDDEPAKIKVKKGDKTWEFRADDEEAIAELPDGIRTFIEPMLGGHGIDVFGEALELDLPEGELHADELHFTPQHDLMERMEKMEQRLKELRDELRELHEEDHD